MKNTPSEIVIKYLKILDNKFFRKVKKLLTSNLKRLYKYKSEDLHKLILKEEFVNENLTYVYTIEASGKYKYKVIKIGKKYKIDNVQYECGCITKGTYDCSVCSGTGWVKKGFLFGSEECPMCNGTGKEICKVCKGSGWIDLYKE